MKGTLHLEMGRWIVRHKELNLPLHPVDTPPEIIEDNSHIYDGTDIDFEIQQIDDADIDIKIDVAKVIFPHPYGNVFN